MLIRELKIQIKTKTKKKVDRKIFLLQSFYERGHHHHNHHLQLDDIQKTAMAMMIHT